MKKWYKICPFCWNEIKEWAIKCQYCKEFLDVKKTEKTEIKEDKIVVKKSKKEKIELKKSDKQKKKVKINYSSIWWTIRDIFSDFWELLKVIFSVWENRIGVWKWITLYLFWMLLIAWFMSLLALPFWEKPFESWESNAFTVLTAAFFIAYLRLYLAPKRAQDHGQPRYVWLIPIVNAFYFLTSGDKGDNQYWEKPSILRTLWSWWYDKKDNRNISKYWAIVLFIIMIILCCLLLPAETKRNNKVYNTNSIIDRPSILNESYFNSEYTDNERLDAFNEVLASYDLLPRENVNLSSEDDYKNKSILYEKIQNCKTYKQDTEDFLKRYNNFINKYYNTDAFWFVNSEAKKFEISLNVFNNLTLSPFVEACTDYYSYLISIQSDFEVNNEWELVFYDQDDLDNFNKKSEERVAAQNNFQEHTIKFAENIQNME